MLQKSPFHAPKVTYQRCKSHLSTLQKSLINAVKVTYQQLIPYKGNDCLTPSVSASWKI